MKSKFNLIALSFLMATTLSSASFASADNLGLEKEVEKKSSAPSYKVRAVKALAEAAVVGGTVRLFMHGIDTQMRDNDPEQIRFQAGAAVVGFSAIRSLFPEEMTVTEVLKALPKFGIKAGFTMGGAFLATSYYETLKALQGSAPVDAETERQERMNYTAYGAMAGNLAGNIVNTTLDGFAWGVKSIFKSVWGSKESSPTVDVNEEEERQAEELRQAEARRVAEEEERQAEELRQAEARRVEEERRIAEEKAQEQDDDDVFALLGTYTSKALDAHDRSATALTEIATSTVTQAKKKNHLEEQWDGVIETSEEIFKERVAASSAKSKQGYTGASTSSSSDD